MRKRVTLILVLVMVVSLCLIVYGENTQGMPKIEKTNKIENNNQGLEGIHNRKPVNRPNELLMLGVLFLIIILQVGVQVWKKHHPKSFNLTTLVFMWLFPGVISIMYLYVRMLLFWIIYTLGTIYYVRLAVQNPLNTSTPRRVYKYLNRLYKISHVVTMIGTVLVALEYMGIHDTLFEPDWWKAHPIYSFFVPSSFIVLFYGLYYGVLVRDSYLVLSTRMATTISANRSHVYSAYDRYCDICSGELNALEDDEEAGGGSKLQSHRRFQSVADAGKEVVLADANEPTTELSCNHKFHEFCIRGWVMLGKRETCPICNEKVDMSLIKIQPWEADSEFYRSVLDLVRFFIVWNPIIILIVQLVVLLFIPH